MSASPTAPVAAPAAAAPAAAAPAAAAGAAGTPEKAAAPPPATDTSLESVLEVEIDGKKEQLTLAQARTRLQKAGAADQRLQAATEKQKKLDALDKLAETDPEEYLRQRGKDPEKIMAALLEKRAKLALMTPEQQEQLRIKDELDQSKKKLAQLEAERAAESKKAQDAKTQEALGQQLINAAQKHELEQTPDVLEGLCDVALELMDLGAIPTADQVAEEYKRRELEHLETRDKKIISRLKGDKLKSFLKSYAPQLLALPAADLLEVLGSQGLRTIQAATLTRIPSAAKKPVANVVAPLPAPPKVVPRNGQGRFVNESDFDQKFRRR